MCKHYVSRGMLQRYKQRCLHLRRKHLYSFPYRHPALHPGQADGMLLVPDTGNRFDSLTDVHFVSDLPISLLTSGYVRGYAPARHRTVPAVRRSDCFQYRSGDRSHGGGVSL